MTNYTVIEHSSHHHHHLLRQIPDQYTNNTSNAFIEETSKRRYNLYNATDKNFECNSVRFMHTRSSRRSVGTLLHVDNPDAFIDGQKDPAKANSRKKAAEKRKTMMEARRVTSTASVILPGSFPNNDKTAEPTRTNPFNQTKH